MGLKVSNTRAQENNKFIQNKKKNKYASESGYNKHRRNINEITKKVVYLVQDEFKLATLDEEEEEEPETV